MPICDPSYLGGKDRKDCDSKPALAKHHLRSPSQSMAGRGGMCLSSQLLGEAQIGGLGSRTAQHKMKPYFKNYQHKKGWGVCLKW
jgi:hypothetical protein